MPALRTTRAAIVAALLFVPAHTAVAEPAAAGATHASADLDQCRNGPSADPATCAGRAWANGNANAIHAHYIEGDSIAYRLRFENLALGTHRVTIEWDTTERGKHALDYLTTYDRTETGADPCTDVPSCGNRTTFAIPADPALAAARVAQVPGSFALFNGTITDVGAYTVDGDYDGSSQTSVTVTFSAEAPRVVLAWGAHIATRNDWGLNASAAGINGSPYHMRLRDLDGRGGNQDRALAVAAVVFPATITIVKDAQPDSATQFPFVAEGAEMSPANFVVVDDATGLSTNRVTFTRLTTFGVPRRVTEGPLPEGWMLAAIHCTVATPDGMALGTATASPAVDASTTTFVLEEANGATCTFTNRQAATSTTTTSAVPSTTTPTPSTTAAPSTATPTPSTTATPSTTTAPPGSNASPSGGTDSATTMPPSAGADPDAGALAFTGSRGGTLASVAAALVVAGAACLAAGSWRRRRRAA